jgi:predicted ATPase/DNA-binding SARP family transcriptional activator
MEFRILGTFEVRSDGRPVAVGGAKPRALLAVLLLHANEPVSAEGLAVALWGEDVAAGAVKTIQVHVSRLRRALGDPEMLSTTAAGYQLRVGPDELDAARFERLAADGHRALADGRHERAARVLREALSLWRGPALADFTFQAFARAEIARLEEERLAALEARVEADLALGRHRELAGELQQLVAVNPLRERLQGQLMLALYRSGRQADALQAYQDAREVLVDQLGIEPSAELRALQQSILAHDPALDPAPRPRRVAVADDGPTAAAHIPAPPTRTVGRDADLARLRELVGEPSSRLVTLVGPGGVGKTRLAVELARGAGDLFPDGVQFVALAPVTAADQVASTVAQQLEVVLMPPESAEQSLARHLGDRELLLVLDNFEHVLDAAPLVADLVAATTDLRVLVTSREPLRLRAERRFQLDPLALPRVGANGGDEVGVEPAPAVELFVAVTRTRDPGFELSRENAPAVVRVCRRLDGLPLAIELAAARTGLLTVPELADRLREGLDALGSAPRDAPARQRTLTATLEWSYALLTPEERAAFTGLAAFAGGSTVEAAEAVTGASLDVLEALVEKNLVVRRPVPSCPTRLTLLETVHAFARDRLAEREDGEHVRRRHCDHYLAFAEWAASELERADSPSLMAEQDREIHNVRAALEWALAASDAERALALATAFSGYWERRQQGREGARWLRAALELSGQVPASMRAAALCGLAFCIAEPLTVGEAEHAARDSLALARSIGDVAQCAASTTALAAAAMGVNRVQDAYRYASEAERLAREAGDEPKRVGALHVKAMMAPTLAEALALGEQLATIYRRTGGERRLALLQTSLTYSALFHHDLAAAQRLTAEALRSAHALGDPFVLSFAYGNDGLVALLGGDDKRASGAFTRELELADRHRYHRMLYEAIDGLAGVAAARGEDGLAAGLRGAAEAAGSDRHDPMIARELDDRLFAPARARLGEQSWRAAHAAGAASTPRQAVDAALQSTVASPVHAAHQVRERGGLA